MLSADIYGAVGRGVPSVAELDAQAQRAQQNKLQLALGQAQFDEYGRKIAADETQRAAVAGFGADTTANYNRLLATGNLAAAQGYQKANLEADKSRADTGNVKATTAKTTVETKEKAFKYYKDVLGTVQDPVAARNFVMHSYTDPTIGPILQAHGTLEEGLARIPSDPVAFKQWHAQAALGIEKLAELAKVQNVNLGGNMVTQSVQPATGQVSTLGTAPITQSADNAATQARIASEGAANRGVQIRGQNLTDARARETHAATVSKPFEITDQATGQPVLVQQSGGKIVPVEGYGPKGGTTGKPLPAPVVKSLTEARDNATTITRLQTDFKPDFAGKGVLGMGADASLAAKGVMGTDRDAVEWWKNYRKQAELVERHALFGAALTPGEQSSWRSADIHPGMDSKVIERNLATRAALAQRVAENTAQDMIDAGHSAPRVKAIAERNKTDGGTDLGDGFTLKR